MNQKAAQQPDVLETINRGLSLSEENRRQHRFEYNLAALAVGSFRVLGSKEFIADLAVFLADGGQETGQRGNILTILGQAAVTADRTIRERTLTLLSDAARYSLHRQDIQEIALLVDGFSKWLAGERDELPGLGVFCLRLEELAAWLLQKALWQDAAKVLTLFAKIHNGELEKCSAVRSVIGQSLSRLGTASTIERLVDGYLQNDHEQESDLAILQSLGLAAVDYLFGRILQSPASEKRQRLLHLVLIIAGEALPEHAENLLRRQQPGAEVLCDIISAVAERDDEGMFPVLQRYLAHEDKEVQHEMIRYIVKLGGREMTDRLLAALGVVHDSLRLTIIRQLAAHAGGDPSVLSALEEFIDSKSTLTSEARQGAVRAVVIALRSYPNRQSMEMLDNLYREYEHIAGSAGLLLQIEQSLNILNPQLRHARHLHHDAGEVVFDTDPMRRQLARSKVAKIEDEVRKILRQGDSKAAGQFLYQQARAAGREKDFIAAEMLRDRIFQVDPMAMAEMVELSDWLENQKKAITEPLLDETWVSLGRLLEPLELKALQKALQRENYNKGDRIIQAGEIDECLFFITSGNVGINCQSGGVEQFLKRMKPGDILGGGTFFNASHWTFSMTALSDVHVHLLRREAFCLLIEKFPELEHKLHRYCARYDEMIAELVKTTGNDRREFPRFPAVRLIAGCLQDPFGAGEATNFHGELINISRQGLAFAVTMSAQENPRLLLGREIASAIKAAGVSLARCSGIVVAVRQRNRITREFSIHIRFVKLMDQITLNRIVSPTA